MSPGQAAAPPTGTGRSAATGVSLGIPECPAAPPGHVLTEPGQALVSSVGETRSNVQSIPLYGPLSGPKGSGPVVNGDTSCNNHPRSSNSAGSAPFFHGRSPLFRRRRRGVRPVFQWSPVHRVLLFRGEVFEWGVGSKRAEFFAREYKSRYGSYRLFSNNCHFFVNRLMRYLDSGCTRMP
uniref:PPPDE domain-containing protein n=1 Tax=Branchiostoma floridae TaxID=7739 RepID=C3Y2X5_BRAFL|eukprot:XP_002609377.1 hypothetical protein BRAFLDRAFT_86468 [Branchiostoma floridae]